MAISSSLVYYSRISRMVYSVWDGKFRIMGILRNTVDENACCEVLFPHER
jgi:hypothetical protein